MPDFELLKLSTTNPKYFAGIYKKYIEKIYRYVYFCTNTNKETAEDITSQTFLNVFEKRKTIFLDESTNFSLLPYLYTTARNLILKNWRQNNNFVVLSVEDFDNIADSINIEANAINQFTTETIFNSLTEVDLTTKEIIYLKIIDRQTFLEIAKDLQLSESVVKMRYYRALELVIKISKKVLNII